MTALSKTSINRFIKLRDFIQKSVPPRRIFMDWYLADRGKDGKYEWSPEKVGCNTAGCIYGWAYMAFCKKKIKSGNTEAVVEFASKFLGLDGGFYPERGAQAQLINQANWPDELLKMYNGGNAKQKKAAVIARLNRVIERGDLR